MIRDLEALDSLELRPHYDVCIAGAGVAGIVLATKLSGRGLSVLLLEAGGLEYSDESQDHYLGGNLGHDYFELETTRLRYLGGTSGHWSGLCRPLDSYDFAERDYMPGSGWPITRADIDPYLTESETILEIKPFGGPEPVYEESEGALKRSPFRASPPVRFGTAYRAALEADPNIDLLLNANVISIEIDRQTGRTEALGFRSYSNPSPRMAKANDFVLAMGGLEIPRLLLIENRRYEHRLGNKSGLVGRYFMEHLQYDVGYMALFHPPGHLSLRLFATTLAFMNREKVSNCHLKAWTYNSGNFSHKAKSLLHDQICGTFMEDFARWFGDMRCVLSDGYLQATVEQAPNRDSRVILSDEVDSFGMPRIDLDWRLHELDKHTMKTASIAFGKYMIEADLGRLKVSDWVLDDEAGFPGFEGHNVAGNHHMGTTRMAANPADGVVDANSLLHGTPNLFIAGSSVFTTSGYAPPTLTILQLTLRLADHLAARKT